MEIKDLQTLIENSLENKNQEFKRLFHGRGNFYGEFSFLTVDSIDSVLYICFFDEVEEKLENSLLGLFSNIYEKYSFEALVLQRRYCLVYSALSEIPDQPISGTKFLLGPDPA